MILSSFFVLIEDLFQRDGGRSKTFSAKRFVSNEVHVSASRRLSRGFDSWQQQQNSKIFQQDKVRTKNSCSNDSSKLWFGRHRGRVDDLDQNPGHGLSATRSSGGCQMQIRSRFFRTTNRIRDSKVDGTMVGWNKNETGDQGFEASVRYLSCPLTNIL